MSAMVEGQRHDLVWSQVYRFVEGLAEGAAPQVGDLASAPGHGCHRLLVGRAEQETLHDDVGSEGEGR